MCLEEKNRLTERCRDTELALGEPRSLWLAGKSTDVGSEGTDISGRPGRGNGGDNAIVGAAKSC